jgi:hypothetical protein
VQPSGTGNGDDEDDGDVDILIYNKEELYIHRCKIYLLYIIMYIYVPIVL